LAKGLKNDRLEDCENNDKCITKGKICQGGEPTNCDWCGRLTCMWVSVLVDDQEIICRPCAKSKGYSRSEIESQEVNL